MSIRGVFLSFYLVTYWIGMVLCKILNFCLTEPITRSTCIWTFAIFLVSSTSKADSWPLFLVNAGICSMACIAPTESAMSKPRSARTASPGSSFFKIPQCSVRCTLLTRPCLEVGWPFNENFEAVQSYSNFLSKRTLKRLWHCILQSFSVWPKYQAI